MSTHQPARASGGWPLVVRATAVVVAAVAVLFQFVQNTDPRFPLAYFTVDSVALLGAVLLVGLLRPGAPALAVMRGAALVGVLLSSVIFSTVIAPHTATGTWFQPWDDPWVRTSTVLMHAVTPVLALADDWLHPAERSPGRWSVVLAWVGWPLVYIAVVGAVTFLTGGTLPYTFLQPSAVGAGTVVAAVVVMAIVSVAGGWLVLGLRAAASRARLLRHDGPAPEGSLAPDLSRTTASGDRGQLAADGRGLPSKHSTPG